MGVPSLFTIELRDASGALCTAPDLHGGNSIGNNNSSNNSNSSSDGGSGTKTGTEVRILVSGPEALRIVGTYTDNKDGTLTGAFTPPVPGLYAIAVYIGTTLLGNDAYRQTAKTPEEMRRTDPAQCVVEGPGLLAPMANDLAVLTVTAVDAAGARRPGGADKVSVLISGPDGEHIVGDVDDNGDGTYTASFLPVKKGTYAIAVYVEAKLVGNDGKPFIVNITKDITEVPVSETPKITKVTSGGKPDDNDNNNNSEGNNNSNNSVWASIETETEEESQDPEVTTEPMLCLASGPGLTDGGAAQETQTFTIRAVNSDGKQRRRGGDRFRVFISGPDSLHIRGKVHDLGNGTYTAAYVPPVEGLYNIAVYMGDVPVGEGKPVQVAVVSSFVGDQRGLNKGKTGTAKDGGSGSGDGKHEGDDGNMLNGSSNEYDDSAETELMERFKVLHEPLNSVKDKPGYLEKKKKAAERMKKKK